MMFCSNMPWNKPIVASPLQKDEPILGRIAAYHVNPSFS